MIIQEFISNSKECGGNIEQLEPLYSKHKFAISNEIYHKLYLWIVEEINQHLNLKNEIVEQSSKILKTELEEQKNISLNIEGENVKTIEIEYKDKNIQATDSLKESQSIEDSSRELVLYLIDSILSNNTKVHTSETIQQDIGQTLNIEKIREKIVPDKNLIMEVIEYCVDKVISQQLPLNNNSQPVEEREVLEISEISTTETQITIDSSIDSSLISTKINIQTESVTETVIEKVQEKITVKELQDAKLSLKIPKVNLRLNLENVNSLVDSHPYYIGLYDLSMDNEMQKDLLEKSIESLYFHYSLMHLNQLHKKSMYSNIIPKINTSDIYLKNTSQYINSELSETLLYRTMISLILSFSFLALLLPNKSNGKKSELDLFSKYVVTPRYEESHKNNKAMEYKIDQPNNYRTFIDSVIVIPSKPEQKDSDNIYAEIISDLSNDELFFPKQSKLKQKTLLSIAVHRNTINNIDLEIEKREVPEEVILYTPLKINLIYDSYFQSITSFLDGSLLYFFNYITIHNFHTESNYAKSEANQQQNLTDIQPLTSSIEKLIELFASKIKSFQIKEFFEIFRTILRFKEFEISHKGCVDFFSSLTTLNIFMNENRWWFLYNNNIFLTFPLVFFSFLYLFSSYF